MANEVRITIQVSGSKNGASVAGSVSFNQDMTGNNFVGNVQIIATTSTAINLGNVTANPGGMMLTNLDAANFIQVDSASTFDKFPQKLLPGKSIFILPETVTIYAKADTASCNMNVVAVDA